MQDKYTTLDTPDTAGPRRPDRRQPDPEAAEALRIADLLQARQRAGLSRLSGLRRFRRWGA